MHSHKFPTLLIATLTIILLTLTLAFPAWAADYKVLYKFKGKNDGANPYAGVILDAAGNLYGSAFGGAYQNGVVFRLAPNPDGRWTRTVLHTFRGSDGTGSYGDLALDPAGNLYGTSIQGGAYGYGAVFRLAPGPDGSWTESVLHSFNLDGKDGYHLTGGLTLDAAGNLYGTTMYGGDVSEGCPWDFGCGTVFRLAPNPDGTWSETVLHSFGEDHASPEHGVVLDTLSNIYGAGRFSGIFRLVPNPDGTWTESIIAPIESGSDLIFDPQGNLYFNSWGYGAHGLGAVWQLLPNPDGSWSSQVIHSFGGRPAMHPVAALVADAAGNLYGTTVGDYQSQNYGTVFKLAPNPDGTWTASRLHRFRLTDGASPCSRLVLDDAGNLYGTTSLGGRTDLCGGGCGVVFRITP